MRAVIVSHAMADPANRGKLRALHALGCELAVAVPDRSVADREGQRKHVDWSDDGGVRVVPIAVRGAADEPGTLRWSGRAVRRLLTDFRPDIVHIEEEPWTHGAATAASIANRLKIPFIAVGHESIPRPYPLTHRLRRATTLRGAAGLVGINQLALGLLTKRRAGVPQAVVPQMGVVPPTTATRETQPGFAIGFVGRLVPERGLDILFRACVKLVRPWTLTVVGTGPAQEELETLAERLGIAARVTWLGGLRRSELAGVWHSFDCLVVPARSTGRWVEPTGLAALEAMAHGIAVIGSSSGALPEVLGTAGIVVPEGDATALAEQLDHLAAMPEERERLGAEGRRRIMAEYSEAAIARRALALWNTVLNARVNP